MTKLQTSMWSEKYVLVLVFYSPSHLDLDLDSSQAHTCRLSLYLGSDWTSLDLDLFWTKVDLTTALLKACVILVWLPRLLIYSLQVPSPSVTFTHPCIVYLLRSVMQELISWGLQNN